MFEIVRLKGKNFVLYEDIDINFRDFESNLVFITGENKDVLGATSNGTGKTLFFDLFTDVMFNKTIRSHATASLIGRFQKWSMGQIIIRDNIRDIMYQITKYRNHPEKKNSVIFLKKDLKSSKKAVDISGKTSTATYQNIQNTFGITWNTFKNRNYYGQDDNNRFINVPDSRKVWIIIDMQGLGVLQKAKKVSHTLLGKIKSSMEIQKAVILSDEDKLASLLEIKRLRDKESIRKKEEMSNEKEKAEKEIETLQREKKYAESMIVGIEDLREELGGLKAEIDEAEEIFDNFSKTKISLQREKDGLVNETEKKDSLIGKFSQLEKEMCDLKNLTTTTCSKCGALLDTERIKKTKKSIEIASGKVISERTKIDSNIEGIESKITSLEKLFKIVKSRKEAIMPTIDKREKLLKKLRGMEKWESALLGIATSISISMKRISTLEKDIIYSSAEDPLILSKIKESKAQLLSRKSNMDNLTNEKEKNMFSEAVFEKTLRVLFDDFLKSLNDYSNEFLQILTEGGIHIQHNAKKEKKDRIADEINTVVSINDGPYRPFSTYSGGEKGKIDLATQIAQFYSGETIFPILFLDEPFVGVDREGRDRIVELLRTISEKGNKVMVVSHDNIVSSYGDSLEIIREKDRSYIKNES